MSVLKKIKSITELELTAKRVFMRVDFNVPLSAYEEGKSRKILETNRIDECLPTIQYALEKGARLILASHLGRPKGKPDPQFSLEPVAAYLAEKLKTDVTLTEDCVGDGIELMTKGLKNAQVLLLENLRFHKDEEENSPEFSRRLSRLCDLYISDAFGTAHRKHASTYGLPLLMQEKGMGFLIEKELKYLDPLLENPHAPFFLLLGGAKVSDKIKTIEVLLKSVKGVAVGGAMAFAFQGALGHVIPPNAKQPELTDIEAAKQILFQASRREIPVLLPKDMNEVFDIGPKAIEEFCEFLSHAKTVFWNGPLGWFEKPPYDQGTVKVAEFLSSLDAVKIVGGGDTVSAIKKSGFESGFDHLSTGGGAVLEYLEGEGLPGIEVLKT